jgi:phosphatidylglycerol:prolipoprotein diacylglycerol transferase
MNSFLIWNQSPFLFTSDFISIRYYSVFFAVGLLLLLYRINKESTDDFSRDYVDKTFLNLLIYMLIGSRIFHCLFYEYGYYSENLLEILLPIRFETLEFIGFQGLSSHGGFIGALIYIFIIFRKKVKFHSFFKFVDCLILNSLIFVSFIRIGNLFNSEIIGKQCSYFFCVAFPLSGYGLIPRHPVQVYECIIYFSIFLFVANLKSKNSFEPGRISLIVVTLAFIGRFLVEFYKEKQSDIIFTYINMGQLLSFLSFLLFFFVYFYTSRGTNNEKGRIIN